MDEKLIFKTVVAYGDVDRAETLTLAGVFRLFQEAAIRHANQFGTGTRAMTARNESWVLNRIAANLTAYPHYEDEVRIETWSRGIDGFRGYREYRLYRDGVELASASSLWLYVNVTSKALVRVPPEIAATFPTFATEPAYPDIDRLRIETPTRRDGASLPVTLRYSDVDVHGHVNNTVYLELLQTALVRAGLSARPQAVRLRFVKEIPAPTDQVVVAWEQRADLRLIFNVSAQDQISAQGEIAWTSA